MPRIYPAPGKRQLSFSCRSCRSLCQRGAKQSFCARPFCFAHIEGCLRLFPRSVRGHAVRLMDMITGGQFRFGGPRVVERRWCAANCIETAAEGLKLLGCAEGGGTVFATANDHACRNIRNFVHSAASPGPARWSADPGSSREALPGRHPLVCGNARHGAPANCLCFQR